MITITILQSLSFLIAHRHLRKPLLGLLPNEINYKKHFFKKSLKMQRKILGSAH